MSGPRKAGPEPARKRRYFGAPPALPFHSPPALIAQLLSFLSVGVLATALQYLLTAGLVLAGWLPLVPASTVGFLVSAAFNYWANARLTFARQGSADERGVLTRERGRREAALTRVEQADLLHRAPRCGRNV